MTDDKKNRLDRRTVRDMEIALQTGALAELGFGPAEPVGGTGLFGLSVRQHASCLQCGAMVALSTEEVPPTERPLYLHWAWHDQQTEGGPS